MQHQDGVILDHVHCRPNYIAEVPDFTVEPKGTVVDTEHEVLKGSSGVGTERITDSGLLMTS